MPLVVPEQAVVTTVSYLADLRAQGLEIASRDEWGSTYDYSSSRTVITPALYLFLHIAVVEDPGDLVGSEHQVMRNVERIGAARFPNTGISYNAASFDTGRLYDGQPLTRRGAHTVNVLGTPGFVGGPNDSTNLNYTARALVLPQMVTDDVTDAQIAAAARWGAACIRAGYVVKGARWFGHRDVAPKDCPGSKAYNRLGELQALTDRYVAEGLDEMELTDKVTFGKGVDAVVPGDLTEITVNAAFSYGAGSFFLGQKILTRLAALETAIASQAGVDVDEEALAQALVVLLPVLNTDALLAAIKALPAETVTAIKEAL